MTTFTPPVLGEELPAALPSEEAIRLLRLRRSTSAKMLGEPGPDRAQLLSILSIAARVPDHRRVAPFRFIVFEGEGRRAAGEILAEAFARAEPDSEAAKIDAERGRFLRAPVVIGVVARLEKEHRTPEWEQTLTVGACCQNLLLAASAHGFAASWVTEWCAYDEEVSRRFGLAAHERFAGFIYIGAARENPRERPRPDIAALISDFSP